MSNPTSASAGSFARSSASIAFGMFALLEPATLTEIAQRTGAAPALGHVRARRAHRTGPQSAITELDDDQQPAHAADQIIDLDVPASG